MSAQYAAVKAVTGWRRAVMKRHRRARRAKMEVGIEVGMEVEEDIAGWSRMLAMEVNCWTEERWDVCWP
jgi:hypothetical protein